MTARFKAWWKTRTIREQRLLLVAISLAVIVSCWLLIVRPVGFALDEAKERHDRAVIERARVQSLVETIDLARQDGSTRPQGPVRDVISDEAVRAGFNVTQMDPMGTDGVRVTIGALRPQAFFAWIHDLESRLGLEIESLTVRPNGDETLAVDAVIRGGR